MDNRKKVLVLVGLVAIAATVFVFRVLPMITGGGQAPSVSTSATPTGDKAVTTPTAKPKPKPKAKKDAEKTATPEAAPGAEAALGAVVPVTLDVLKLAPESAMIAVGVPPLSSLYEKGVALAKKIVPAEVNVDEVLAAKAAEAATTANTPDAKTFMDIIRAKGVNPDAPFAVFVDIGPTAVSAARVVNALGEAAKAAAPPADTTAAEPKSGAAEPEAKADAEKKDTAADATAADATSTNEKLEAAVDALELPSLVIVVSCTDAKIAETALKESLAMKNEVDISKVTDSDAGNGIIMHAFNETQYAYFVSGDKLVFGNSRTMLEETLMRFGAPAAVRYGTVECPASEPDELAVIVELDKMMPLMKDLLPSLLALSPMTAAYAAMDMTALQQALEAYAGADPVVATLAWTDKKLEILTRMDFGKSTAMAAYAGPASPLRLATVMPENTMVLLSLALNGKLKENIKTWMGAVPAEMKSEPGYMQAKAQVETAMSMLGDEIALAMTAGTPENPLPSLFLLVSMANAEGGKAMITAMAPLTESEKHNENPIYDLAVGTPLPVYLAFAGDAVLMTTDKEGMKKVMDLIANKGTSNLFGSLDPALDPALPRYNILLFNSKILDTVKQLASLAGGIPEEAQMPVEMVAKLVRELRVTADLKDNWLEKRLTVFMN